MWYERTWLFALPSLLGAVWARVKAREREEARRFESLGILVPRMGSGAAGDGIVRYINTPYDRYKGSYVPPPISTP